MLKTLQITSLAALSLAVCGVVLLAFMAFRENPDIIAYLDNPGITAKFMNQETDKGQIDLDSPLAAQAQQFGLRINPPPLVTVAEKSDLPKVTLGRKEPEERSATSITPIDPPDPKFILLATVMCRENPNRSMVLLRQAGDKDEWFWQGERVGDVDVAEVRNGSAIFTRNGQNPKEYFVPKKPNTKSLLAAVQS